MISTRPISRVVLLGAVAMAASGCWNGAAQAPLTPESDVTLTSAQAYAAQPQYFVTGSTRTDHELTLRIDVIDLGRAASIARQAIDEQKGNATKVVVYVYGPAGRPDMAPWRTLEWTARGGSTGLEPGQRR